MTEPHTQPTRRPVREKRVRVLLDRALSASAGLVALSALAVSMYQAWIAREQQKMSAWPYVTQDNTGQGGGYAYLVHNVGLGPALVRSMRVYLDGKPVVYWSDLIMAGLHLDSASFVARVRAAQFATSSVRPGMVLLPGTTTQLAHVADPSFGSVLRDLLNDRRVHLRVCYCSLYKDCWQSDSQEPEPTEVRECPKADPALEFQS